MGRAAKTIATVVSDFDKGYVLGVAHDEVGLATWAAAVTGDYLKLMLH